MPYSSTFMTIKKIIKGIKKIDEIEKENSRKYGMCGKYKTSGSHLTETIEISFDEKEDSKETNGQDIDEPQAPIDVCNDVSNRFCSATSPDNSADVSSGNICTEKSCISNESTTIRLCLYKCRLFMKIRNIKNVDTLFVNDEFIYSSDLVGKSGSILFFTSDFRFLIKTIRKTEKNTLLSILPSYVKYIENNPETFLSMYYGCYEIQMDDIFTYFIVMKNFLPVTDIFQLYDLKGSLYKRKSKNKNKYVLKDLNWKENHSRIHIRSNSDLVSQIKKDAQFLKSGKIMDYSLLVGIKKVNCEHTDDSDIFNSSLNKTGATSSDPSLSTDSSMDEIPEKLTTHRNHTVTGIRYVIVHDDTKISPSKFILTSPADDLNRCHLSDIDGINEIYYIGIIDILTRWNWKKFLEYLVNRVFCKKEFSSVDPEQYCARFTRMVENEIFFQSANTK